MTFFLSWIPVDVLVVEYFIFEQYTNKYKRKDDDKRVGIALYIGTWYTRM